MPPATAIRYEPLSGLEVKEAILAEVRAALDAHPDLTHNVAFPKITWIWNLSLEAFPMLNPSHVDASGNFVAQGALPAKKPKAIEIGDRKAIGTEHAPSRVRELLSNARDLFTGTPRLADEPDQENT